MKKISDSQIKEFFVVNKPEIGSGDAFMDEVKGKLSNPELYFEARVHAVKAAERKRFRSIVLIVSLLGIILALFIANSGGFDGLVQYVFYKFSMFEFLFSLRFVIVGTVLLLPALLIPLKLSEN